MIVWTNQPYSVYQQLKKTGRFVCDPRQALDHEFTDYAAAYHWMQIQLKRKVGLPPADVTTPIWAWYRRNWHHQRPDFRDRHDYADQVCLEVEVAESQILLSDFEHWNFVLNDWRISMVTSEAAWEQDQVWFMSLPKAQQQRVKHHSWQQIFDITQRHGDWEKNGDTVQGCFWELRWPQVRRAWRLQGRERAVELEVSGTEPFYD